MITKGILQFDRKVIKTKVDNDEVDVITISVKPKSICVPMTISVPAKKSPLLIIVPGPVSYVADKAVPWSYGAELYYQGEEGFYSEV